MTSEINSDQRDAYPGIFNSADAGSIAAQKWYLLLCVLRLGALVSVAAVAAVIMLLHPGWTVAKIRCGTRGR